MTHELGTGKVGVGKCKSSKKISREDVTTILELCMNNSKTFGLAFDVTGGVVPVKEVVDEAADSFQGYY